MKDFDYVLARTPDEAAAAATKTGAVLKGAGIDLLDRIKEGIAQPDTLVNLLSVRGLAGISQDGDTFRIGALTTLAEIEHSELLLKPARALCVAAALAATPQLRNRATVGGNLAQRPRCWYFRNQTYECSRKGGTICYALEGENKYHAIFDNEICCVVHPSNLAPALGVLDAIVHVAGPEPGKIQDIEIGKFWVKPEEDITRENVLKPGQVIVGVSFKVPPDGTGTTYYDTREKDSFDWPLAAAACRITQSGGVVKEARIVVAGVAPTPLRMEAAEAVLVGKRWTQDLAKEAGAKAAGGAKPLRDNAYKAKHLAVCVERALLSAAQRSGANTK